MTGHRELSVHQEHELLGKLELAGLSEEDAQKVIESRDNALAQRVVPFIRHGGNPTTSMKTASGIMGHNFIRLGALTEHFGIDIDEEMFMRFCEVPFTEEELAERRDTHILFPGYPLSLEKIWKKHRKLFQSEVDPWFKGRGCSFQTVHCWWYLIRKECAPGTKGKIFRDMTLAIRQGKEFIPRACDMAYVIILFYLEKGIRLFENEMARCDDIPQEMYHVAVGNFKKQEGLWVTGVFDEQSDDRNGLSSSCIHPIP